MTQGLIIVGDVLDGLARLDDDSVDAVVTDPPYELAFMGSKWDATGVAFRQETWEACLRVLKPGGHLIAFGGGRTHHRMWCAIEDAGFEVRELVCWLFGTGFPKSLDVSKAIDKVAPRAGMFDAFARHFAERRAASGRTQKDIAQHFLSKTGRLTGCVWNWENGANVPTVAQWYVLRSLLDLSDEWLPLIERVEAEREVVGTKRAAIGLPGAGVPEEMKKVPVTAPATDAAKQWEGYGTALKPAVEPILLARKPLSEPTVAANVLKWGTGALAIDATRIGTDDGTRNRPPHTPSERTYAQDAWTQNPDNSRPFDAQGRGRWPANVIFECTCDDPQPLPEKARKRKNEPTQSKLYADAGATNFAAKPGAVRREGGGFVHQPDCPAGMLDAQSGKLHAPVSSGRKGAASASGFLGELGAQSQESNYADTGGASRFFYCAKASRAERERGLEDFELVTGAEAVNRKPDTAGLKSPRADAGRSAGTGLTKRDIIGAWVNEVLEAVRQADMARFLRQVTEGFSSADASGWSTTSSGKRRTGQSQTDLKSTTETETGSTTDSGTSDSLTTPHISAFIRAAFSELESGLSPADFAACRSRLIERTGTSAKKAGRSTDAAAHAISERLSVISAEGGLPVGVGVRNAHPT